MSCVEVDDPSARFQMRFSVRRFENVMKTLSNKQRDILVKHGYDRFLNLKYRAAFPVHLIDWIMHNMVPSLAIFQHGTKRINFNKCMVQQFLGFYSGDVPEKTFSDDPVITTKVNMLKQKYMKNGAPKLYTKQIIKEMNGDEDEESFLRSFILFWLATIVCPSTSDSVDWKFLYSMIDIPMIKNSDWCSLCLQCIVIETASFVKRISALPNGIPNKPLYVGGCLPVLSVSYMDYLDLNSDAIEYEIDYGVPRIFHVRTSDFLLVTSVDRIPGSSRFVFGALNFRPNSSTPYSKSAVRGAIEQECRRHQSALLSISDGLSGPSSNHLPGSSSKANATSSGDKSSHKTKILVDSIVQSHKAELLRDVQSLIEKRFLLMSESIQAALPSEEVVGVKRDGGVMVTVPMTKSVPAHHNNSPGGTSDANVNGTFSSAVKPKDGITLANQSHSSEMGSIPNQQDIILSHDQIQEHIVDDNSPSPQLELLSKIAQGSKSIDDSIIASTEQAALGIEIAMSYACNSHQMPVFDQSPLGDLLGSSKRVVYDLTPKSKDAQLPVFDPSPMQSDGGGTLLDDVSRTVSTSIVKKNRRQRHSSAIRADGGAALLDGISPLLVPNPVENMKRKQRSGSTRSRFSHEEESAEQFYDKYLANKFFKTKEECEKTHQWHTVTYEKFYDSFKARGDISNEVMVCYTELMNDRVHRSSTDNNAVKKLCFSPYFTSKLNVPPEIFDVNSVSRELRKLNKKFNLAKCDLLEFPVLHDFHWMLLCLNLLSKKHNLLDSLEDSNKLKKSKMASNMVANFHKACVEARCIDLDMTLFEHEYTANVPQQNTTFDCGVFVMLYMEKFKGQQFEETAPVLISDFRKATAHDMSSSSLNDMTSQVENFKKQKLI